MAVSAALGYSGSAAGMAAPAEVVVVNEPLAVEVTNPVAIVDPVAVDIAEPLAVEVVNPTPPSPPAPEAIEPKTAPGVR